MIPISNVTPIHTAVKGRARFRIVGLYRSSTLRSALECGLSRALSIYVVNANQLTGNLLVPFDPYQDLQEIITAIDRLIQAIVQLRDASQSSTMADPKPTALSKGIASHHKTKSQSQYLEPVPRSSPPPLPSPLPRGRVREGVPPRIAPTPPPPQPWYLLDTEEVVMALKSSRTHGLASSPAAQRLKQYGPNRLPEAVPRSALSIFLNQFNSLPVLLLGASAAISVFTGGLVDAAVILSVVLINAGIGFFTESQAEKTINALTSMVRRSALVLRDGRLEELPTEQVVPGDVLTFAPGSYVAADARLLEIRNLAVDESAHTEESQPVL